MVKDERVDVRLVQRYLPENLPAVPVPDSHVPVKRRGGNQPACLRWDSSELGFWGLLRKRFEARVIQTVD